MLAIVFLILFIVMAYRVAKIVVHEAPILEEFKQTKALGVVALLFPLGPIALTVLPYRTGWLPAVFVAFLCYLPALIIGHQHIKALESSGTDRTNAAAKGAHQAFGTALTGLVYIGLWLLFVLAASDT